MNSFFRAILFLPLIPFYGASICLTMVVHNQEAFVQRCLNSTKDLIDCISIYDTGSTDNTLVMIEHFMKETGIPGKIHKGRSRNFDHNQTFSIYAARETLKELGFSLSDTYLFTLEGDKTLNIGSGFRKESLKEDSYLLLEKAANLSHYTYNPHLFRANLPIGTSKPPAKLRTLIIDDQWDHESKQEQLKQNIELLTQNLALEPNNKRYLFYLAESHKSLKHYEEAINWYQTLINQGTDREEIWFSKYTIGECYEELNQWEHALYWYLEAYQYAPSRAEPLRKITTHYRNQGQNDLAYIFAKHGLRILPPDDQNLFPSPPLSDYQFDEELSIVAYYTRFKNEGFLAANDLVLKKNVPWHVKDQTYRNMLFYMQPLKNLQFQPIECDLPLIEIGFDERYHPMNPSIQKTDEGYSLICRAVNYTQKGAKIFNTIDAKGIFRTKNFLIEYDRDFKILSQNEIIEDLPRERVHAFLLDGLDDCRIFQYNHHSWFTCNTSDTNPTGNIQISLCQLNDETTHVETLLPLLGPDPHRCEKNWLPFVKDQMIHIVYSCHPFTIYQPDLETGACKTICSYEPDHDFSRFRGSAAPIAFDDGYLMLVHEVVFLPEYERCYLHRFLYLDRDFIITQISTPFVFQHFGVEFACSMTIDHSGTKLIIPIGIEDHEAHLSFIDLDTVRSFLKPLPPTP